MARSSIVRDLEEAAHAFVATVAQIGPGQWEQPGLGVWSVRDLVGHTTRALRTIEAYASAPAASEALRSPVDYYIQALPTLGDPALVAQRGREAGAALGADPLGAVRDIVERVLALVAGLDEGQLITTPVGGMRLDAYLPTRTFELVVHTLDLARAIGVPFEPPTAALTSSLRLAAELAARQGRGAEALLALTGRGPLPDGFTVL